MAYKLTVNVSDKDTVERAQAFARKHGKNLSQIIDGFLQSLGKDDNEQNPDLSPRLRRMVKRIRKPASSKMVYRDVLVKEINKRLKR